MTIFECLNNPERITSLKNAILYAIFILLSSTVNFVISVLPNLGEKTVYLNIFEMSIVALLDEFA